MDREQAVAWLCSVGRNAMARDWGMGETILVYVGEPSFAGEIGVYPAAVYLYPTAAGGWNLWDCGLADPTEEYADLETAVRAAHEYVGRKELALIAQRSG